MMRLRAAPYAAMLTLALVLTLGLSPGLGLLPAQAQTSSAPAATAMSGGVLRALDKLTGQVQDLTLTTGTRAAFGRIEVALLECRVPRNNPAGDAFALITVTEVDRPAPVFEGWIIASSPALNAMDHARYDVWALRCSNA